MKAPQPRLVTVLPSSRGERLAALEARDRALYAIEFETRKERTELRDEILSLRTSLTPEEAGDYDRARIRTQVRR